METLAFQATLMCIVCIGSFVVAGPTSKHAGSLELVRAKRSARQAQLVLHMRMKLFELLRILGRAPLVKYVLTFEQVSYLVGYAKAHLLKKSGLSKAEIVALFICSDVLFSLVCWWFFTTPLGAIVCVAAAIIVTPIVASALKAKEAERLAHEMPQVFRTLAMALSSGMTLTQAIEYVGSKGEGQIESAFARSAMRLRSGETLASALKLLGQEIDAPGMQLISTALLIAQRTGSPLKELFEESAKLVERQGEFERLLSVKTAQVRLSIRMVCILPILLLCALSLMSPDFRAGLMSAGGMASVLVAVALDALALWVLRRIMKDVIS